MASSFENNGLYQRNRAELDRGQADGAWRANGASLQPLEKNVEGGVHAMPSDAAFPTEITLTRRLSRDGMKILLQYLNYLRPVLGCFIIAIISGVVYAGASGFGIPFMAERVFPMVMGSDAPRTDFITILAWAAFIPAVMTLRGVAGFINSYCISYCGLKVLEGLRMRIFRKLQELPIAYLDRAASGDLIARCQTDTVVAQQAITGVANDFVRAPLQLVAAFGYLVFLGIRHQQLLLLFLAIAIVPIFVFPIVAAGKHILRRSREAQARMGDQTSFLSQNIRATREIRAYNIEEKQIAIFKSMIDRLLILQLKIVKYSRGMPPIIETISAIGVAFAFVYAYYAGITINVFLPLIFAIFMSYEPIKKIGAAQNMLQRGRGAMERLEEILREPVAIQDPDQPVEVACLRGHIRFENVSFSYGGNGVKALREIDVEIQPGNIFALVGPSGSGKTTFISLIPRFYDVTSGRVTIDGIDIRDMRQADLRRDIALVTQSPYLFDDTAINNILVGRPSATREEAVAAARLAYADEFISALPNGYDTEIGEGAFSLSGGQRQRLALARAFLKDAPILILDEATSALDSESEQKIKDALKRLMRGKTVIIIAHRFGTILHADRIFLFDGGGISAAGTHHELYDLSPLYRALYDNQILEASKQETASDK